MLAAMFQVLRCSMMQLRFRTATCVGWALRRVLRAAVVSTSSRGPFGAAVVGAGVMGGGVLARWETSMHAFGGRVVLLRLGTVAIGRALRRWVPRRVPRRMVVPLRPPRLVAVPGGAGGARTEGA